MDTLTSVMEAFKIMAQKGLIAVKPMAMGLFGSLLVLDFTWAVIKMMLDGNGNYLKLITEKLVRYGIFFLFLTNYENILKQVIDSFITVGLAAGQNNLTATTFANPSDLVLKGFTILEPLKKIILQTSGLEALGMFILLGFVYLLVILAYFVMAIQVFITYLEMYVVGTLAIIFVGCGVNKQTAFLAEKAFGAIISYGVKLMVLACILSMAEPIMTSIVLTVDDKNAFEIYLKLLVGVAAIAFFMWQAPGVAAGLMSGSPSLTAGSVAGAVMAGTAAGIGLAMGGKGLAGKIGGMMGGGGSDGGGGGGSGGPDVSSAANTIQAAGKLGGMSSGAGGGGDSLGAGGGDSKAGEGGSPSANGMTAESVKDSIRPEKPGGNAGAGGEGSGASASTSDSGSTAGAGGTSVGGGDSSVDGGADSGASASTSDSGSTASAGDASIDGGDSSVGGGADRSTSASMADSGSTASASASVGGSDSSVGGGADRSASAITADSGSTASAGDASIDGGDSSAGGGERGASETLADAGGASSGESFTVVGSQTSSSPSANGMTVEGLKEHQTGEKSKSTSSASSMAGKIALAKQAIPEEASPQGGVHVPITHDD